jgi:predicted molibdopterin-dependent oxidoreductase YjgC
MRDLNPGPMRNIGTAYEPIDPAILELTARYGRDPEALLPIFQELQTRQGGLTDKIVSDVARSLGIPAAQAQGVAGGGVNPLCGQNNVQGSCDMGALPDVFPGYQAVTDAAARAQFATAWAFQGADGRPAPVPMFGDTPGGTVVELIHQAGDGKVRALYVLGEDPMMTGPDLNAIRRCLEACEFVVLQEIFPSQTAPFADVMLPGTSWAEKSGTFTNTERRIQPVRQAIAPVGEA